MSLLRSSRCLPLLLLAIALCGALVQLARVKADNHARIQESSDQLADRVVAGTRQRLMRFEAGLRAARGAVIGAGGTGIRWDVFEQYTLSRDHAREFPGSRGFGFIRRVPDPELGAYLEQQRALGRPYFSLRAMAASNSEHYIIEIIEPVAANRPALGLDIASEPLRRQAADAAMRSGEATLTAPITLVQAEQNSGRALLMLLPVYGYGAFPRTPAEREQATFGWTYTPLLIDEVLSNLDWSESDFHLALRDITDPARPQLFFGHADEDSGDVHPLKQYRQIDAYGRVWQMEVAPTDAFVAGLHLRQAGREAALLALAGFLLALALYLYLRHREGAALDRAREARLAAIVESSESAIIGEDLEGRVTDWNPAAERLFGYAEREALGRPVAELILPPAGAEDEAITRRAVLGGRSMLRAHSTRRQRNGALLEVEISESPIYDGAGKVVGVSSMLRDLTRQRVVERTFHELTQLGSVHVGTDFVDCAAEALRRLIGADRLYVARVEPSTGATRLELMSSWSEGGKDEVRSLPLAGAPCEVVYDPSVRREGDVPLPDGCELIPQGAHARFDLLKDSGCEAFIGFPLRDRERRLVGHIGALFRRPISAGEQTSLQEVGRLFAHRVEAELLRLDVEAERNRAMEKLRVLNLSLESEVAARTGEIQRVSALQKAVIDNAGYAVLASDADGYMTVFNAAAEAMLGYRAAEMIGRFAVTFQDPEEIEQRARELSAELGEPIEPGLECFVAKARLGMKDEREWTFICKDGKRLPVMFNVSTLLDDGGTILGFLGIAVDLTERKTLEGALTAERDRFRSILDLAPSAILTVNSRGVIEKANARTEEVFGYRREEIEGQPIELLIDMADRGAHVGLRERYLSDGANARLMSGRAVAALHRDGHRIPMEVRLSRFQDADGIKVIAIATDRSEQQTLAESEERWRTMANVIPHLVWMLEPDGSVDFVSRQTLEYTGSSEIAGWSWGDVVHPDDYERVVRCMRDGAADGQSIDFEYRIRRSDKVYRWFHARAVPLHDERGKIVKWIGTSTDIDDRKQAEQQVREINATLERRIDERTHALDIARRDLQNILDALPSMVGYWDRDQRNGFANHAFQRWFGIEPSDVPGRTLAEILGPQLYALNRPHVEAVLRGERQAFEREDRDARGAVYYSQSLYIPNIVDGEVRGFYALVHDITEVRRAQAAAEAASAAKSIFLANMSHEIRTPLNAVLGMLQLLARTPLEFTQREHVDKAGAAARTLLGILNDILDFSKIEAGKMSLDPQPFGLDELMREIGVLLATSRGDKPIELIFDVGADVPRRLIGDALRLKQVLINLAGNALKFTERGEVVLSVQVVRVDPHRAELSFAVRDTGIGMSADQCRRVFDSFMQGEVATTRRYGGTGLGLAISQRLTVLMGGELYVYSAPGAGSTFRFTLPFGRPASPIRPALTSPLKGLHAILVEDNLTAREVLSGVMRGFGWTLDAYPDCATLADTLNADTPCDVVVLDWPPPSGACEAALSRMQDQSHTLLIGLASDLRLARPDAMPGSLLRPAAVLTKPVTASQLLDTIMQARMRGHPGDSHQGDTPPPGAVELPRRLDGLRILVVEDNPTNQIVAQGLLAAEGAQVSLAGGGVSGVAAVRQASPPFDVVLMDVQMPDIDGYEATRRIRELPQGVRLPVIAMTANAMSSDREDCLRAGMNEHVAKPFELSRLVEVILACLGPASATLPATADAAAGEAAVAARPLLDLERAVARMGGDQGTYREVLRSALGDLPLLYAGVRDTATEPATRLGQVHTLKGLAGTVGAERLQAASLQAERLFKLGAHEAWLQEHAFEFDACFADSLDALRGVLARPDAQGGAPRAPVGPLLPALEQLVSLLAASSGDALALFEELRQGHSDHDPEAFAELGDAIHALDFSRAEQCCRALIETLHAEEAC